MHHIINIPLSKAEHMAKLQVKKSCVEDEFGLIIQSVTYGFRILFNGEKHDWKEEKSE